jgi:hypothetical protein
MGHSAKCYYNQGFPTPYHLIPARPCHTFGTWITEVCSSSVPGIAGYRDEEFSSSVRAARCILKSSHAVLTTPGKVQTALANAPCLRPRDPAGFEKTLPPRWTGRAVRVAQRREPEISRTKKPFLRFSLPSRSAGPRTCGGFRLGKLTVHRRLSRYQSVA